MPSFNRGFVLVLIVAASVSAVLGSMIFEDLALGAGAGEPDLATPEVEMQAWQKPQDKRNPRRICGERLIATLRAVCRGQYARQTAVRRSDPAVSVLPSEDTENHDSVINFSSDSNASGENTNAIELPWPYSPKSSSPHGGEATYQRFRRNIVDECCRKSCTVVEMRRYCS